MSTETQEELTPALYIVHWPGQDVAACDKHLQQLVGVAAIMGFQLSWTPCPEFQECGNCKTARLRK